MAILATGNTFADGDQVTSTKLNNIANAATFAADAVDDSTTALSGGKIIIKDGGVTPAKLSTNHPNWDSTGLGVGTSSPSSKLDVESSSSSADGVDINNTSTGDPVIEFQLSGTSTFTMGVDNSDSDKFKIGTTAVETATCLTIDSTGPQLTIGNGAAADTAIIFDGNAQDFYIALDDSADDLLIGLGSTIGTTPAIAIDENLQSTFGGDVVIGGTTPTLTIGDAGAEDTAIVFDGNAKDFYIALDDSADKLVIGEGSTIGTNSILTITDDSVTIGDASAVDTKIVFDGNAQDFYIGLDDSADDLVIGFGSTVGTTPSISVDENQLATFGAGITSTAAANTLGATSFNDADITNVGSIALDTITNDGTDVTIDSSGDIILDADGAQVRLKDAGTERFVFNLDATPELDVTGGDFTIHQTTSDADIIFTGNDGGAGITALTLDMSAAGAATFNDKIVATELDISGDVDVDGTLETDAFSINGTTVSSTAAELNLLDGSSANTVVNSKAVIYGSSGEVAGTLSTAAQTSVTSLGTLTALTVDDVAINGKVITMTGSTSDTAVLTVGTNGTLSIVTTDAGAAAANIQITADGTVDIDSAGVLTLDSGAAINIEPASGSAILLDGTISVDAGVVTGATSITSTAFVGDITGDVTGNVSGTAATVTTAAQSNITSLGTLTTLTVDNVIINGTTIGHTDDTDLMTVADGALTVAGTIGSGAITSTGIVTAVGTSVFTNLDISGDVDIDGTTNLDAVDIDGNVQIDGTVTVGVDDTGKDVKFFGATAGSYMLWDESLNDLILEQAIIEMNVSGDGNGDKAIVINSEGINFESNDGIIQGTHAGGGATSGGYWLKFSSGGADVFTVRGDGNTDIAGALSKGSGSFKIQHPLESKKETHQLVHSFIEGPQADLIYRGKVDLVDGSATVNVDTASGMTDGTFVVLCRDIQSFTTNESGWTAVRSSVSDNILTIEAQDPTSTDSISWMVVGERQDDHMIDTGWTDEIGKVIVEPLIEEEDDE
jgi:cytoskeletal protein CcmA (bactofilin family)